MVSWRVEAMKSGAGFGPEPTPVATATSRTGLRSPEQAERAGSAATASIRANVLNPVFIRLVQPHADPCRPEPFATGPVRSSKNGR
jgi:hypothetical protein